MGEKQVKALVSKPYPDLLQLIQDGLTEAEFVANGQKQLVDCHGRAVFAFFGPKSQGLMHYDAAFAADFAALVNAGIFWPLKYVPDVVVAKLSRQTDVIPAAAAKLTAMAR